MAAETGVYLFVYGSLLDAKNEFSLYLKQHSRFYAEGKFKGELFDTGDYPGAILRPGGNEFVYGSIYILNSEANLKVLDDYEGFGDNHPQPNEFIRKLIIVVSDLGVTGCWVYLYNLPVNGLVQIVNGDYLRYKGLR